MDNRDIYEISFNLGPAEKQIDSLLAKLSALESRIIKTFGMIETMVVGSTNKAVGELGRLSQAIDQSLDNIEKKAGRRKKPIVIVEQKDVQEVKKNLDSMGDAVTVLAKQVDEEATKIAEDIKNAFQPPPTLATDTQIFPDVTQINSGTQAQPTPSQFPGAVYRTELNTQALPQPTIPATPIPSLPVGQPLVVDEKEMQQQAKEAERAERALVRLLAAELKVAAGADAITREYIETAAATAKSADAYIDQVAAIAKVGTAQEKLTKDQVDYAVAVAKTKNEINILNRQLQEQAAAYNASRNRLEENINVQRGTPEGPALDAAAEQTKQAFQAFEREKELRDEIIEKIDFQVAKLRFLNDEREKGAAAAQKQAELEKLGEEAKAAIIDDASARRVAAAKLLNKQREQAAAQFVRIARSMGVESTALNQLAQKYGIFQVTLKKTADQSNALEKEFHDIIRASPQLSQAFDQLIDQVGEFQVKADPSTFRSAQGFFLDPNDIRQLGFAFQRFGVTGVAAFGEIYAAIGPVGLAIGAVTVGVVTLIKTFVAMAKAGVQAFRDILQASIDLSRQRETTQAQFEAYLGSADLAAQALERIDQISNRLGQDISPIAQSFLPLVGSIKELELFAEVAASLALSKPNKTIQDANTALREFSGGDITSLRKLFEIPSWVLDDMKAAVDSTGDLSAGMQILDDYLTRTGKSVEALGDTFDFGLGRAREILNTFGRELGGPIVAALGDALDEILGLLSENEGDIRSFVQGVGTEIADIVRQVSDIAISLAKGFDAESLNTALDRIERISFAIGKLVESADGLDRVGGGFFSVGKNVDYIVTQIEKLTLMLSGAIALYEAFVGTVELINRSILYGISVVAEGVGVVSEDVLAKQLEQIRELETHLGVVDQRYADINDQLVQLEKRQLGLPIGDVDSLQRDSGDDTSALDEALAAAHEEQTEEIGKALEEYQDDIGKLRNDIRNSIIERGIKLSDQLLDFLEEYARKRKELAEKNRDDLIDLEDDYDRKVRDAKTDLSDDLEDADIEEGRRRIKQAREYADKRLEIEEDYQRKIAEIRRKYAFDLQEAARQNDAVAYLRLLRQRDFDLNEARIKRDEALSDVDTDEDKKNAEASEKRREDEEDARLSYKRKLRDLQTWLDDQQAEIKKNYKRELDDLVDQEEQKRKEIIKAYQRDLRDISIHYDMRLQELNKKYAEEYDLVAMWEKRIVEMQQEIRSQFGTSNIGIGKNAPGGAGGRGLGDEPTQPGDRQGSRNGMGGGGRPWNDSPPEQANHSREWYEQQVERLARQLGYNNIVATIPFMSLQNLIRAYQNLSRMAGAPTRDSGGHVGANQTVVVGGNGRPEYFTPATAGYITPASALYRQPLSPAVQSYRYDNRRMNVDLSLLDTAMLDRSIAELVKLQIVRTMEEAFA